MKSVEGEFENLNFHDAELKNIKIGTREIVIDLSFAHIADTHSQNISHDIICAKDCQLVFTEVEESIVKVHISEQQGWKIMNYPESKDLLGDIIETELTDEGYYKLSGMTTGSAWGEWLIKAENVILRWSVECTSWLTKK